MEQKARVSDEMRPDEGITMRDETAAGAQGVAGWIIGGLRNWRGNNISQQKQLRVLESLSLGGKRQLMLGSCGEERFLVGGGSDSVETIVRVGMVGNLEAPTGSPGEICR